VSGTRPRVDLHDLDPATWRRIDEILDRLIDLPPDQATRAAAELCAGDARLRDQVIAILATDAEAEGYLSRASREEMMAEAAGAVDFGLPPLEGRTLGAWRLLRPIGRGGMGAVYLGERADGAFEQTVAVKVLGRGIASADLLARFRQERQILARLEHPNIARLIDGGVTDDGLWWFAMEHVTGSPITEWSAAQRLGTRAVIELFQQVCGAVQYAHRNLVVHRDLKPANILVSEAGQAKLLDFGIAKILAADESALDSGGPDTTQLTTAAMTPNYAAPEQIRGEPPTTATDLYALGVVLYELLTGTRPYRVKTGSIEETRRAVLEEEPEAPSARARRLRGAGAQTDRLPVARELDHIALTALRKEPEQRYSSVEALSEDLQRHLDGRPVRASGRTFGYLASKFVRQYRVPVAAAALVLVALLGGLYATARERDRARLEAAKATELKEFALGLFRASDANQGRAADLTARELLGQGAARVEKELKGNPRVQAEMWDLLGSVYRSLDLFPQAISAYSKSVALRRAMRVPRDTLLATSLRELGSAIFENGDYRGGERVVREALDMERRVFGEVHPRFALALGELATLRNRAGADAEAESLYHRVIVLDSLVFGMNHPTTAVDIANLGMLHYYASRYHEAIPYIARALAIRRRALGHENQETATGFDQMGMALAAAGESDSGIVLMREALAIRRRVLQPDHPDIAHSLMNLGSQLASVGALDESERSIREALAIRSRSLDPKDPLLAHTHNDLAVTFYREQLLDSAEVHFLEAIRIWSHSLPPDHQDVLTTRCNLGVIAREKGRYAEAEHLLRTVLDLRRRTLGPDQYDVSTAEYHLGRTYVMAGRPAEGESLLRHAIEIRRAELDEDDPRVAEARLALGNGLIAMGRVQDGRALIRRSLESAETRLGPKDKMVVLARARR
jgi:serine/threonine protein kinase